MDTKFKSEESKIHFTLKIFILAFVIFLLLWFGNLMNKEKENGEAFNLIWIIGK